MSSSSLGGVRIWNIGHEELTTEPRTLLLARWAPYDMSANGRWLALGNKGQVEVFHLEPGAVQSVYSWGPDESTDESTDESLLKVAISSGGSWLAAGFSQGTIWLQKLGQNPDASPRRLSHHSKAITALRFTPGEDHLFATDKAGSTSLWDLDNLKERARTIPLPQPLDHQGVAFSSDSRWMVAGYKNGAMVWDLSQKEPIGIPIAQESDSKKLTAFAVDPSGPHLVTGHLSIVAKVMAIL